MSSTFLGPIAGRILICGGRNWTDYGCVLRELRARSSRFHTVIHGACRGADVLGGRAAAECGLAIREFPADWQRYGRKAGFIRNTQMLHQGRPSFVLAFHGHIDQSAGTRMMIDIALDADIRVRLIEH